MFSVSPPQNLSECSCVSADSNFATAVPGKCPMPGCQEAFLIFLCVVCVCSLVGAMAQTPSVIILIRYSQRLRARARFWTRRGNEGIQTISASLSGL